MPFIARQTTVEASRTTGMAKEAVTASMVEHRSAL